jgi:hypothetical protein
MYLTPEINAYNILIENPDWKGPVEGLRLKWENNIKIYPKEVRCKNADRIRLAEGGGDQ